MVRSRSGSGSGLEGSPLAQDAILNKPGRSGARSSPSAGMLGGGIKGNARRGSAMDLAYRCADEGGTRRRRRRLPPQPVSLLLPAACLIAHAPAAGASPPASSRYRAIVGLIAIPVLLIGTVLLIMPRGSPFVHDFSRAQPFDQQA